MYSISEIMCDNAVDTPSCCCTYRHTCGTSQHIPLKVACKAVVMSCVPAPATPAARHCCPSVLTCCFTNVLGAARRQSRAAPPYALTSPPAPSLMPP
jgi:hypothetical protein